MRAFTDAPQCAKCWYAFAGDERDAYMYCKVCAQVRDQEHLHCACPVCGYTWLMECGDANDEDDQEEPEENGEDQDKVTPPEETPET